MDLTQEIEKKVAAAQENSKRAADDSKTTIDMLLSDRKVKVLQYIATIVAVGIVWWGAATSWEDFKNTQVQQGITIESHGVRLDKIDMHLDKIDTKMSAMDERTQNIRSDTSHMRDIIERWHNELLQPVQGAHVGARQ
jgi:hypothetical protein